MIDFQEDAKPAAAAVAAAPPAEAPAKAEKPKNPLDALPPSKMVRSQTDSLLNLACAGHLSTQPAGSTLLQARLSTRCAIVSSSSVACSWDGPGVMFFSTGTVAHAACGMAWADAIKRASPFHLNIRHLGPQVLDSWKRLYSNTPAAKFREICVAGLWNGADVPNSPTQEHFEGFDPEVRPVTAHQPPLAAADGLYRWCI